MPSIGLFVHHYDRVRLLARTLHSIAAQGYPDLHVLVVDNDSPSEAQRELRALQALYPHYVFVNRPKPDPANWFSSLITQNWALHHMIACWQPDVIMRQDAECYHVGDVLRAAAEIYPGEYLSFGCFSADRALTEDADFARRGPEAARDCTREARGNGDLAWYNHPVYRAVGYDFCGALCRADAIRLNGFDERYAAGQAVADQDLVRRIRIAGLRTTITCEPFVIHQWHYDGTYVLDGALWKRNLDLFQRIARTEETPKATHTSTPDFEVI